MKIEVLEEIVEAPVGSVVPSASEVALVLRGLADAVASASVHLNPRCSSVYCTVALGLLTVVVASFMSYHDVRGWRLFLGFMVFLVVLAAV